MIKDELIETILRKTGRWDKEQGIRDAVDAFEQALLQQTPVSGSLPLIIKAIDDTFNQVHYSHLHPDVVKPMEHGSWREKWIKDNCGNDR